MERRYRTSRLNAVGDPARTCKEVRRSGNRLPQRSKRRCDKPGHRTPRTRRATWWPCVRARKIKPTAAMMPQSASTSGSMRSCASAQAARVATPTLIGDLCCVTNSSSRHQKQERRYHHEREVEVNGALEGHVRPEPVQAARPRRRRATISPTVWRDEEHRGGRMPASDQAHEKVERRDRVPGRM